MQNQIHVSINGQPLSLDGGVGGVDCFQVTASPADGSVPAPQAPLTADESELTSFSTLDVIPTAADADVDSTATTSRPDDESVERERLNAAAAATAPEPTSADTTASSATPPAVSKPSAPVWELDQFRWPSACQELYERETEYFEHAGEKLRAASEQGLHILAITSAHREEGCSTLAICLGRAVAAAGGRVALMDADLQHPRLGEELGLSFTKGWQDAIEKQLPWPETAVASLEDGLAVIPAQRRQMAGKTAELVGAPNLLREIASNFDLLIVDLGRLSVDAHEILGHGADSAADAAIVVRDMRTTAAEDTLAAASQLRKWGLHAVGIAENFRQQQSARAAA
jgi:Mrp family chromosome partitioning ATPase